MKKVSAFLTAAVFAVSLSSSPTALAAPDAAFTELCGARAKAAGDFALKGDAQGWLFLRSELEHVAKGEFWKGSASPAASVTGVIKKFHETLAAQGVTLVVVPVPTKASIYPDRLSSAAKPDAVAPLEPFLKELATATGAVVVDVEPAFRAAAAAGQGDPVFCATDSHWSPAGVRMAEAEIFKAVRELPDVKPLLKPGVFAAAPPDKLEIRGDLTESEGTRGTPPETLTISRVGRATTGGTVKAVPEAPDSPVLLLGDSHTMVFTDGPSLGMHTVGAGLRDALQGDFGFPLAQISNQNSGVEGARRVLTARQRANPNFWKGRKLVIWVFAAKEFTLGKWR